MSFPGRDYRSSIYLRLLLCALLLLPAGCANFQRALDASYREAQAQNYERALTHLERSSLAGSRNNRLLYLMEKGVLLHLGQQYRQSNEVLEEADRLAEELFTRSLSAESLSFVANDLLIPYAGEDYESAYLHYYKARNYLALGELDSARVEARKLDEKLSHLAGRHGGRHAFRDSAFLRLLTGFIYEAGGEWNDAYIAYNRSLAHYQEAEKLYGVSAPALLWGRLLLAAQKTGLQEEYDEHLSAARAAGIEPVTEEGVIVVIIDQGYIPVKREAAGVFPSPQGFPVKLALPEFQRRGVPVPGPVEVRGEHPEWLAAERVENVAAVARQSLEDKKGRVIAKMIARAAAKQLAAWKAEKELGPSAGLLAQMAALVTENADLRSWTMLPEQIAVAVLPADPGRHQVTIRQGGSLETHTVEMGAQGAGFVLTRM